MRSNLLQLLAAVSTLDIDLDASSVSVNTDLRAKTKLGTMALHKRLQESSKITSHDVPLNSALLCTAWFYKEEGVPIDNLRPSFIGRARKLFDDGILELSNGKLFFTQEVNAIFDNTDGWGELFQTCRDKIDEIQLCPPSIGTQISLQTYQTDGAKVGATLRKTAGDTITNETKVARGDYMHSLLEFAPVPNNNRNRPIMIAFRAFLSSHFIGENGHASFDAMVEELRSGGLIKDFRLPRGIAKGAKFTPEASEVLMDGVDKIGKGYGKIFVNSMRNPHENDSQILTNMTCTNVEGNKVRIYINQSEMSKDLRELFLSVTLDIKNQWMALMKSPK